MENTTGQFFQENLKNQQQKIKNRVFKLKQRRFSMFFVIAVLMVLSSINMVSAAFYMKPTNIKKHFMYILIFFVIYLFIGNAKKIKRLKFSYKILSDRKVNGFIFLTSIFILLGMCIGGKMNLSFIPQINGAYGWINLGPISIQPAEILKCAFVINMANCLARAEDNDLSESLTIMNASIYLGIYGILILAQKDMGTAIHYLAIWLFMVFMSKLKDKWVLRVSCLGGIVGIIKMNGEENGN